MNAPRITCDARLAHSKRRKNDRLGTTCGATASLFSPVLLHFRCRKHDTEDARPIQPGDVNRFEVQAA